LVREGHDISQVHLLLQHDFNMRRRNPEAAASGFLCLQSECPEVITTSGHFCFRLGVFTKFRELIIDSVISLYWQMRVFCLFLFAPPHALLIFPLPWP